MYSYEDRIRAVELYIKLGKRIRATIRQLGYPTKNALKGWHREYKRRLDLPKGYARSKARYSQEQKEVAVRHYLDHGRSIAFTIRELGYPVRESLRSWIHELHPELHVRIVGRSHGIAGPPAMKQAAVIALSKLDPYADKLATWLAIEATKSRKQRRNLRQIHTASI